MVGLLAAVLAVAASTGSSGATVAPDADVGGEHDRRAESHVAASADAGDRVARPDDARHGAGSAVPDARIEGLFPSPPTDGDDGEAVRVHFSDAVDGADWRLVDDAGHVARLPNRTLSGSVVLSPEPSVAGDLLGREDVLAVDGRLRLADAGDEVRLVGPNDSTVDRVAYERAEDGLQYVRSDRAGASTGETDAATPTESSTTAPAGPEVAWHWRSPGTTSVQPNRTTPAAARAFVLPDGADEVDRALRSADERLYVGGYELTAERVVDALIQVNETGVDVRVLVDGSPVGGTSRAQVDALDRLAAADVDVTVLAGDPPRFRTHHPKYAVIDDTALVLTENWKPAGTGGAASRGWGVWLDDRTIASGLATVFREDAAGRGARDWLTYRSSVEPVDPDQAGGSYPARFPPAEVDVDSARLVLAPDDADRELPGVLRSADETLRIQQVSIGDRDDPLLAAALDAARDGVSVEILLSSAWYVEEENRALARELRGLAERENLSLSVGLVDPDDAFAKTHVKGAIVDDRTVVVGSLNWNPTALRQNREVVVVLESEAAAAYYGRVFEADAAGASTVGAASDRVRPTGTPVGLVVAVVLAWVGFATLVGTRVRWRW